MILEVRTYRETVDLDLHRFRDLRRSRGKVSNVEEVSRDDLRILVTGARMDLVSDSCLSGSGAESGCGKSVISDLGGTFIGG